MNVQNSPGTYQRSIAELTTTATAYADGDVIGGRLAFTYDLAANGGKIVKFVVFDPSNLLLGNFEVLIFNSAPTTVADNAAFALTDADLPKLVAHIKQTDIVNSSAGGKGINTALLSTPFTGDNLWAFVRNVEGEDPLQFVASKTVTFEMTVEQ